MIVDSGVAVPEDMAAALTADPEAWAAFRSLRPGDQLEFVRWVAKPGADRTERISELAAHVRNFRPRAHG